MWVRVPLFALSYFIGGFVDGAEPSTSRESDGGTIGDTIDAIRAARAASAAADPAWTYRLVVPAWVCPTRYAIPAMLAPGRLAR